MDKLNLMLSFITLIEQGSYTGAGKKLEKTKALISTHVSQLEKLLDIKLINRTTRSMEPTQEGYAYYENVKRIINEIQSLERNISKYGDNLSGELRIIAHPCINTKMLNDFVAQLMNSCRLLSTHLEFSERRHPSLTRTFDIGLVIDKVESHELVYKKLSAEPTVICASPAFIEQYGYPADPKALEELPCIIDSSLPFDNHWPFTVNNQSVLIDVNAVASVNGPVATIELALSLAAVILCPATAVANQLKSGALKQLFVAQHQYAIPIYVVYPNAQHMPALTKRFINLLRENTIGSELEAP